MYRFFIFLLSLAAVAIPAAPWAATSTTSNLAINVTPGQAITGISLSNNTFTGGAASGTVVGAISATMSPATPAFSGSLSLSGANASQFQISGSNLVTNGTVAAGTYNINIVATEAGAADSPFTQSETITGTSSPSGGAEIPGPSQALFASPPYTCTSNKYVSPTGGGDGSSPSSPWTTAQAAAYAAPAGTCINLADGTYNIAGAVTLTHGGNAATPSGYVVWRGTTITNKVPNAHLVEANTGDASDIIKLQAAYLWIDGLDIDGNNAAERLNCIAPPDYGRVGVQYHHLWLTNSYVIGCGQAGAQWNISEYFYFVHDTFGPSAYNPGYAEASNVSIYQPFALCTSSSTPYPSCTSIAGEITYATRTTCNSGTDPTGCAGNTKYAYDNYWCSTGTYPYCYNIVFAYNVSWGSYNPSGGTDGEGLILDDWPGGQTYNGSCPVSGGNCTYPNNGLVMGNVFYFNGSNGHHTFTGGTNGGHVVVVNNTSYDNNVDTTTSGTFRGGIENYGWTPAVMINNVSKAVVGTAGATNNNTAYLACCNTSNPNVWQTNVAAPPSAAIQRGNGTVDSFPSTGANANVEGDPLFINATPGTFSSHTPGNSNFALCTGVNTPVNGCTGASPAIGLGQTFSLWQQTTPGSIDAGACVSGLTSCP